MRATSSIGRRFDLFTNESALANTSNHSFLIHNEKNWFGEETLFPSGHKNSRVDVLHNGIIIWQGIVRSAIIDRENEKIELKSEDILSRVLRLPFGLPVDVQQQGYAFGEDDDIIIQPVYTNLFTSVLSTLGQISNPAPTGSENVASGFLARGTMNAGVGITNRQYNLMRNFNIVLNNNERSSFRERLLPLLSALGLALVPAYDDPGRLNLVAAKRGGDDVRTTSFSTNPSLDYASYPTISTNQIKAGSYRETPAENQVINSLRLKLPGLDEEHLYRGDTSYQSRASLSRLEFGQRIPPAFDLSLLAAAATLDAEGELVFIHPSVVSWLNFLIEKRAYGARRCELALDLDKLGDLIAAAPGDWSLPIVPFHHAFHLDIGFNKASSPPIRGWWYVVGTALIYDKNELILYLEEGERQGWSYAVANLPVPASGTSGNAL